MNKKYKILLIVLLLLYPVYKGIRELFWVRYDSYTINNVMKIKLRTDTDMLGFQDINDDKTITITNNETKAEMKTSFLSLEPNLYFYIKILNSKKTLSIVDKFAGQNMYDYSTLKLIGNQDCFKEYGGCGGFDDSSFNSLGLPYLTYDYEGFHK